MHANRLPFFRSNLSSSVFALAVSLAVLLPAAHAGEPGPVTIRSLLEEMVDRDAVARWPDPAYATAQFSSYDRASVAPGDESWWSNRDAAQFMRTEEHEGRWELVLMDADGPGAIVRIWSANPPGDGTLRIYLDGSDEPALAAPMADLLGGKFSGVGPPLSAVRSRGWNLYLPIPYAKHCLVTCDRGDFYYQINYRTYEPGTRVRSFTMDELEKANGPLARVQRQLDDPSAEAPLGAPTKRLSAEGEIAPGAVYAPDFGLIGGGLGPASVRELTLQVRGDDLAAALRTTVLVLDFDNRQTVWCPIGDFYGSGLGLNPYQGWWRTARRPVTAPDSAELSCRWVMPFRASMKLRLLNLGDRAVDCAVSVRIGPWSWNDRSMHFHTVWRQESPIPTLPRQDWNYVEIDGRGVFVGDTLAVTNPVKTWWGEGDEKIYVDGETFPSHFGTGTEDYYGYAWCCPEPFEAPFHAQPRCDGPDNYGHTTVTRVRTLDAIPFTDSLRFDMEIWHWKECEVGYAATSHFYAVPGATHNRPPQPTEAARGAVDPPPLPPPHRIEGAIEAETMRVANHTAGLSFTAQDGFGPKLWSNEQHLWVRAMNEGDYIELEIPAPGDGPQRVFVHATLSWDYGIVRFTLAGGSRKGVEVDLFNTAARAVATTGAIDLGVVQPRGGTIVLRAKVVGSNVRSEKPGTFFGIDCVVLTPP